MISKTNSTDEEKNILYDLRQRRAKLIADCIEDVMISAKEEKYYIWFKNIEDLYDVSEHTYKDIEKVEKEFKELKGKVTKLANDYSTSWAGKNKQAKECSEIESSLRNLFKYVLRAIEESGLFGKGYVYDEDEI